MTGKTPSQRYAELEAEFGASAYQRVDAPASPAQKAALGKLAPEAVTATELAGEPITAKLSHAPGNGAAIGGLKVQTEHAWFAARPSGTEDVYKLYAESLRGPEHLAQVQAEAREVVSQALAGLTSARRVTATNASDLPQVTAAEQTNRPNPREGRMGSGDGCQAT